MAGRDILWFQHVNNGGISSNDMKNIDEVVTLDREPTIDDFSDDITFIKYNGLIYSKRGDEVITIWHTLPHNHNDLYYLKDEVDSNFIKFGRVGKGDFYEFYNNKNESKFTLPIKNIYNTDGTIIGIRTITLSTNSLLKLYSQNDFTNFVIASSKQKGGMLTLQNSNQKYELYTDGNFNIYSTETDKIFLTYDVTNDTLNKDSNKIIDTSDVISPVTLCVATTATNIARDQIYPFDYIINDSHNAFDTNTHKYTVPKTAKYRIKWGGFIGKFSSGQYFLYTLQKNGSTQHGYVSLDTRSTRYGDNGWMEIILDLNQGDVLNIYFNSSGDADYGKTAYSRFIVEEIVKGIK